MLKREMNIETVPINLTYRIWPTYQQLGVHLPVSACSHPASAIAQGLTARIFWAF